MPSTLYILDVSKDREERIIKTVDLSWMLPVGDTLASALVSVTDSSGVDQSVSIVGTVSVTPTGVVSYQLIQAFSNNNQLPGKYNIFIDGTTTAGQKLPISGTLTITGDTVLHGTTTLTVSPASVTLIEGATQQLTATLKDASGNPIAGQIVGWSTSAKARAAIDGTGLITAGTIGSATITVTCAGLSVAVPVTVILDDEAHWLAANLNGADALIDLHSVRGGVTLDASNSVTKWSDYRGAGHGLDLTPVNATGPKLAGTGVADYTIQPGSQLALQSAADALYDLSLAKTIAFVSDFPNTTQGGPVSVGDDAIANFLVIEPTSAAGYEELNVIVNNAQTHINPGEGQHRTYSTKLKLHIMCVEPGFAYLNAPPYGEQRATINNFSTTTPRLLVGKEAGVWFTGNVRAVLVLGRRYTPADLVTLKAWAAKFHNAVTDSDTLYVFEGDSITAGAGVTGAGLQYVWTQVVMDRAFYGTRAFANVGISSSQITDAASPPLDITKRYPANVSWLLAPRTRNVLMVFAGTNDVAQEGVSGSTAATRLWAYCDARRAEGWKVVVATPVGRKWGSSVGIITSQAALDTELNNLRAAIRTGYASHADAMVDFYADARLQDYTNTTYFATDGIHPNQSGNSVMADVADPVLQALG